jgi:hypothetical protein
MAGQAERGILLVDERNSCQDGRFPAGRVMALAAIRIEFALVDGWFGVACGAIRRHPLQGPARLAGLLLVGVALHAAELSMVPFEREGGSFVVERNHSILPIMAVQATLPEVLQVLAHEFRIVSLVAGRAGLPRKCQPAAFVRVAFPAGHRP